MVGLHSHEASVLCDGYDIKISWRSPVPVNLKIGDWISFQAVWEINDGETYWAFSRLAIQIRAATRPAGVYVFYVPS